MNNKPQFRWILLGTGLLLATAYVTWSLAANPTMAPVSPPPEASFPQALIESGSRLAGAGNCVSCHTTAEGPALGGGNGFETGFGLVYSTNISPDTATGIGTWSEAAFARALRQGVSRDGQHLLPAFPYTHFTKLGDADIQALYAYFMTRPPVSTQARLNTMGFPFNVRRLQAGWKLLFFRAGEYQNAAAESEAWNRGAYLAEGIAHCAACHTPRNSLGAERRDLPYAGSKFEGWLAPPLNATNPAPLPWTQQDLYAYLRTGQSPLHGAAAGVMTGVVHDGLGKLADSDVQALAVYYSQINGSAARLAGTPAALSLALSRRLVDVGQETDAGANLYLAACAACHYDAPPGARKGKASLTLSTSITADVPSNFIQTVLRGVGGTGGPGPFMPAYASSLTNTDIARLATYLRRTRTDLPAWRTLPAAIAALRPEDRPST